MADTNLPNNPTPVASPTGTYQAGATLPAVGSPEYNQSVANAKATQPQPAQNTPTNTSDPTGLDDGSYLQLMNGLNSSLQQNNTLVTQKNFIQKQLFDQPLSPDEIKQLPPDMQTVISSGNRDQMQLQLKIINDSLQGRNDSVAKSIGFLTTGYQQNETNTRDAITSLETYATNNGLKLGDLVQAMAPLVGKNVADQLGANLSKLNYPYIKSGLQPSTSQDNSGTVVDGYDLGATGTLGAYAADPNQPAQVRAINDAITNQFGSIPDAQTADAAVQSLTPGSPITGSMIMSASQQYGVDPGVLISVMQNDSSLGTKGEAVGTMNPGNVGNTGTSTSSMNSWQDGVNAVAQNLAQRESKPDSVSSAPPDPATANIIDPVTHVSPQGIYEAAVDYAFTQKMPSLGLGAGVGPSTVRGNIISIAGAIANDSGLNFPQMKMAYAADASATKQNVERLARVESIENSLVNQFPRLESLADKVKSEGINLTESDVQAGSAAVQAKFGSPDAAAYIELLNTIRSDYSAQNAALAGSRGGEFFAQSAQAAIPLGYSSAEYSALSDTISKSADNIKEGIIQEVSDLAAGVKTPGTSGSSSTPGGTVDASSFFASKGIDYTALKNANPNMSDTDLMSEYNSQNPQ